MDFTTVVRLSTAANLREQPAVILELVHAYHERSVTAHTGAEGFMYGYVAALEWVLQLKKGETTSDKSVPPAEVPK